MSNFGWIDKSVEIHIKIASYIWKYEEHGYRAIGKRCRNTGCLQYVPLFGQRKAFSLSGVGIPQTSIDELKAASKECEFRLLLKELNISSARGTAALKSMVLCRKSVSMRALFKSMEDEHLNFGSYIAHQYLEISGRTGYPS